MALKTESRELLLTCSVSLLCCEKTSVALACKTPQNSKNADNFIASGILCRRHERPGKKDFFSYFYIG